MPGKRYWVDGEDRPRCSCHGEPMVSPSAWRCSHKMRANAQRYWGRNPDKLRLNNAYERKIFRNYGLTLDQYNLMLEDQGGKCLICSSEDGLVVDHCHNSGQVRGLLCGRCNSVLGFARDNPEILERAKGYLLAHQFRIAFSAVCERNLI